MREYTCLVCERKFVPSRRNHVYCVRKCSEKAFRARFKKKHGVERSTWYKQNHPGYKEWADKYMAEWKACNPEYFREWGENHPGYFKEWGSRPENREWRREYDKWRYVKALL